MESDLGAQGVEKPVGKHGNYLPNVGLIACIHVLENVALTFVKS